MPFKSEAQRKWMYANEPEMAKKWEEHTKNKNLPKRSKKKKKMKKVKREKKTLIDNKISDALNLILGND